MPCLQNTYYNKNISIKTTVPIIKVMKNEINIIHTKNDNGVGENIKSLILKKDLKTKAIKTVGTHIKYDLIFVSNPFIKTPLF